ncbi:MAG TPA: DUF402 domain-containing protein [Pyrinomonadaceae bacterium]|nr:DUF402 domain-containing protein [Pyrinomonadaceae bacterium]
MKTINVRTYKYDGHEHRRWRARLFEKRGTLLVLDAEFEEEIQHMLLGTIARGTISREYYWLDRWYNVFRFKEPTGALKSFYCNINAPPVFYKSSLSYIDLDMDILVAPDLSYTVLDEEEFARNILKYNYPLEIQRKSRLALEELISLIESRQFPFNDLK